MADAYIFPADTPVSEARKEWFRSFGFELKSWPGTMVAPRAQAILIAVPVRCSNRQFVFPEGVWKLYLTKINPMVRLIQIGLRYDQVGPNYMHWFNPPEDFRAFWEKSKPISELTFSFPMGFITLETLWKRFWDGHDKGGFYHYFVQAKMPVQVALDNLIARPENVESEKSFLRNIGLAGYLQDCQKQWVQYQPYWEASPFTKEMALLQTKLKQFELDLSGQDNCPSFLEKLSSLQENITSITSIVDSVAPYFKT